MGYRLQVIAVLILCSLFRISGRAEVWRTHFAYNNVTQIAMSSNRVYAVSDGNLYSVEKQSEQIKVYNRQSGLHETGITCIHYDQVGQQLIIAYGNGKIDLLSSRGVQYISELYTKDMTQRKTIYNVTLSGRTAYLSTHYGVQTMDLRENKLVDSYWLRPGGEETPVKDIVLSSDSIYAFTDDSLFCASLSSNLVDYRVWKREIRSGRIAPDENKGKHYQDATSHWYAGGSDGIRRVMATGQLSYKPQGPLQNTPYRLTATQGNVWVVPGGRWAVQYQQPGVVMVYRNGQWINIPTDAIVSKTNKPALDFMNVAVDPNDMTHYFVTSYGTGLYEFKGDTIFHRYIPGSDNTLVSVIPNSPDYYTRLDYALYDTTGNLWLMDAGTVNHLQCLEANGTWHGLTITVDDKNLEFHTPGALFFDRIHPNHKWMATGRFNTFVSLTDDQGTPFDTSDDLTQYRKTWTNQHGASFTPQEIYEMMQDRRGNVWICTDQGIAYIAAATDFYTSDAIVQPDIMDENGENPMTTLVIQSVCQTPDGLIWVASKNLGVYVLNEDATEIVTQYTTDNSAMPSNGILSITCDDNGKVWIGTAEGLVEYDPNGSPEGLSGITDDETSHLEEGSMRQWRLYSSYYDPQEIAASHRRVYAVADGSLFSVDRTDYSMEYWNKSTGLNGTSVAHIAYAPSAQQLVIAYEDGRIDLMNDNGSSVLIPDLYMKAGSVPVSINCLSVGAKMVYAGTPFGIVVINAHKAEIADTYYIGEEASYVDVQTIIELGDTLYAISEDKIYKANLHDNLVDYTYWKSEAVPGGGIQQAVVWRNVLYTLQHDSLYRHAGGSWQLVRPEPVRDISANDGQLLVRLNDQALYRLTDDDQLDGLCNSYYINTAIFTHGEYWIAARNYGLVKLDTNGDQHFPTEGPNSNTGYSVLAAHGHLYSTIGGRWATEYLNNARCNIYDGNNWRRYMYYDFANVFGKLILDPVCIAVDPNDAGHFFMATYGTGVIEFRDFAIYKHYTADNSTLQPVSTTVPADRYTRTDGAYMDEQGNLWVMNATTIGKPLHVLTPSGQWVGLSLRSNGSALSFSTPSGIWPDRRKGQFKWMFDQRGTPGVVLMNDGGTPTINSDDYCLKRNQFIDQNGNLLSPANYYSFAQDHTNRIWLGTEKGIILLPAEEDFYSSNACRRIIIPRNDGSGLGDYLLGDEQINCMAVDGGNRMWIGTANSGLYLIEDDTITVAHFTEANSLLPSDNILSLSIDPKTGKVWVGTDKGIASYLSDASEPQETMDGAYAYPNPVTPDYVGDISITGLMDNSEVRIVDAGGNLVCKTRSHGGTAIWDGKDAYGRRATPGIYTALCNANGGHTAVKIMVIR